jgi:FkbM family methyltransferase
MSNLSKFTVSGLLKNEEQIKIIDVGAMSIGAENDSYETLYNSGKIRVIGFEPDEGECRKLNNASNGVHEYHPYFIGNGKPANYYKTNRTMTGSLFEPNAELLQLFQNLNELTLLEETIQVETVRLDDLAFLADIDFIKIDVQGSELQVFENAVNLLSDVFLIQTEVEFVELYKNQPLFADVDRFLRSQGFQFHTFTNRGSRCYKPLIIENNINRGLNQLLWSDAVYVKDETHLRSATPEKLLKTAILLHDLYASLDFCHHLLSLYDEKCSTGIAQSYLAYLAGEQDSLKQLMA